MKNLRKYYSDDGEKVNFERFVCALALDKNSPRVAAMTEKLWAKLDPSSSGCTDASCIEKVLKNKEFMDRIVSRFGTGTITKDAWL